MISFAFHSFRRAVMVAGMGLVAVVAQAQTPLLHYTLDGSGTDSGLIGVNGTLAGNAVYGASGSGVGRFDKALSTVDGTNDYFTAATGGNSALSGSALTIALWVNMDSASSSVIDRLVANASGSTGFDFGINSYSAGTGAGGADAFTLTLALNSVSGGSVSTSAGYVSDKWLFLAVTYDGANIRFYSGDETTGLGLNTTAAKTGSIVASSAALEVGGTPATTNDRSPAALFNDVRIYNSALTLSQLESIRVSAIPEPSQGALILGALAAGLIVVRRGRRGARA